MKEVIAVLEEVIAMVADTRSGTEEVKSEAKEVIAVTEDTWSTTEDTRSERYFGAKPGKSSRS